jgi:membrane fusion protein
MQRNGQTTDENTSCTLTSPAVNAYGKAQQLVAGMQLEADIVQDSRTILEWMFESVFSLKGRL